MHAVSPLMELQMDVNIEDVEQKPDGNTGSGRGKPLQLG
jgi:hypothetical protein